MSQPPSSFAPPAIAARLDAGERVPFVDGNVRCTIERTGRSFLVRDAAGQPLGVHSSFAEAWAARPRSSMPENEAAA